MSTAGDSHGHAGALTPSRPPAAVGKRMSTIVMGTSSQGSHESAGALYDCFYAAGGRSFDTAWIYGLNYGPGCCERVLGAWLRGAGVRPAVTVLGKGGHPPHCWPEAVRQQLDESLYRLGIERFDTYMLHRDNPQVPVGEFVEALCAIVDEGLAGAYGFSNWSLPRVREAVDHAHRHGLRPPVAVSNQLSLTKMVQPVYPGCESADGPAWREWFTASGMSLFAWSSQGRGAFTALGAPHELRTSPLADCWYSEENRARLERAHRLARLRGSMPVNVALAWVMSQPYSVFPIIGPRTPSELLSSLGALDLELTADEAAWLDLERSDP
jgi:aryl-alcohol dehydrogenase-like predicted oxidoreductase